MGMFDEIVCDMPLPGTPPTFIEPGHRFQTKDTEPQYLEVHTIRADGTFSIEDFTGDVEFYTSNICGCGPGVYTRNGEDAESVTYKAHIVKGKVLSLTEEAREVGPAFPSARQSAPIPRLTDEDIDRIRRRNQEPLIGKTVYVLWGGQSDGYQADVVAETENNVCLRSSQKGRRDLEVLPRSHRNHIFFDTEAEAKSDRDKDRADWSVRRREFDEYAEKWRADRATAGAPT